MFKVSTFKKKIFTLDKKNFETKAMQVFGYQAKHCDIYRQYLNLLSVDYQKIKSLKDIPFLPIELFKTHDIVCGEGKIQQTFSSSKTTGMTSSQHHILDLELYEQSFSSIFNYFYGDISEYCVLALLPSYLERTGSSLIFMAEKWIENSKHPNSGFYLYNYDELFAVLQHLEAKKQKTILLGVSFALCDFAEEYNLKLKHTIVMETGGMKGRRKEILRTELHQLLKNAFGVSQIHSEYGMTELLSQAYSQGNERFHCPPSMQVLIREVNDPFSWMKNEQTGGVNIVDLANVHSCSFLATSDLGKRFDDGSFELLGRFDHSDTRGCNLLVE
ncbi:MAG: acyl transferase [Chitinophagales bacterium]